MSQNTTYPVQPLQNFRNTFPGQESVTHNHVVVSNQLPYPVPGDCLRAQIGRWEIMLRGPCDGLTDDIVAAFHTFANAVKKAVREAKP